jgi:hypothetical protein
MRVSSLLTGVSLLVIAMAILVAINPFGRNLGGRNEPALTLITGSR